MKLLLKFNLVFLLVFAIGFGVAATVARELLRRDARAEVLDRARLLMEKAAVVSLHRRAHRAAARDADEIQLPARVGAVVRVDRDS